jgi:hypothetical protein
VSTYCAEVLSAAQDRTAQHESGRPPVARRNPIPDVKFLLISQRTDGFFLERFNERGESVVLIHWNTCAGDLSSDRGLSHLPGAITGTPKAAQARQPKVSLSPRTVGSNAGRTADSPAAYVTPRQLLAPT